MDKNQSILVLGSNGLVGSALVRELNKQGYENILTPKRKTLDLLDKNKVQSYFTQLSPQYVFLAAAKVGGIMANKTYPATFGYENTTITLNVLEAARNTASVKKLLFLGSSCIYPKDAETPIREDSLLSGKLEPTNELYALSKILGIKMCQAYCQQYGCDFISCMPCNLYGPNDNFDPHNSHVLPAFIKRIYEAKEYGTPSITCWGDGTPLREFLYVDDLARACIFLIDNYSESETVNVGPGIDISIGDLSKKIASIIGYEGRILWDKSKPNGTMKKTLDISKIKKLGWTPSVALDDGLKSTIDWYVSQVGKK